MQQFSCDRASLRCTSCNAVIHIFSIKVNELIYETYIPNSSKSCFVYVLWGFRFWHRSNSFGDPVWIKFCWRYLESFVFCVRSRILLSFLHSRRSLMSLVSLLFQTAFHRDIWLRGESRACLRNASKSPACLGQYNLLCRILPYFLIYVSIAFILFPLNRSRGFDSTFADTNSPNVCAQTINIGYRLNRSDISLPCSYYSADLNTESLTNLPASVIIVLT